ncbi:MAG: HEAT repeat domain-containing protein [Acidobacteriaceae bacterium]|nr:HEAT repeat domain-containing protein [Acidobacteriaceae bacterium]
MPSRKIEQQIEKLKSLRASTPSDETLVVLKKALADRANLVVAKAASVTAELNLHSLIPDLLNAFERLFDNGAESDPQCWGKNAISKALKDLEYLESRPYLLGIHYVQMEPVWGKRVDTAMTLRGTCALALVDCRDLPREDKLRHLTDSLTDAETPVRMDVTRALAQMEGIEPALLLRLKARTGDENAGVTGQVLESLLNLEGKIALAFVTAFLRAPDDEIREEAALALGASRLPGAVSVLIEAWNNTPGSAFREVLLRSISASRQQSAIEFLLHIVREDRERDALAALKALELHRGSTEIHRQIAKAVHDRPEPSLQEQFRTYLKE